MTLNFELANFECRYIIPKRNRLKFSTLHSPICLFIRKKKILKLNGHPGYFKVYFSGLNYQMRFKMVHFSIKTQNLELVNLKCVIYAKPVSVLKTLRALLQTKIIMIENTCRLNSCPCVGVWAWGGCVCVCVCVRGVLPLVCNNDVQCGPDLHRTLTHFQEKGNSAGVQRFC